MLEKKRDREFESVSVSQRKTGASALCTVDDANCFHMIRLELKTSECEKNVTVVFTVTGCDVCKDNTSKDPLSHCSHGFRESRHRCVHRSV